MTFAVRSTFFMPMTIQYILFDLDETLYTDTTGLFTEVGVRIEAWLVQMLHLSPEEARALRRKYYLAYGTTMMGLLRHHPELDVDDYLDAAHDVDVAAYLAPNPALDDLLNALPVPKAIFTNGIADWADRVLTQLGVREHFGPIIDVRATHYRGKPWPEAYQQALAIMACPGSACVFVDDQPRNLKPAADFGMRTVLVAPDGEPEDGVDFAVDTILDVGSVLHLLLTE